MSVEEVEKLDMMIQEIRQKERENLREHFKNHIILKEAEKHGLNITQQEEIADLLIGAIRVFCLVRE